jgi:hypothetical protein
MGYVALDKIYLTKKGNLRAKILIETKDNTDSHILKITNKTNSFISGNGYAFFVTLIDIEKQIIKITIQNKSYNAIKLNHFINVGGKITIDTLINETNI